MMMYCSTE
jgi:hypothetical protein